MNDDLLYRKKMIIIPAIVLYGIAFCLSSSIGRRSHCNRPGHWIN